jgi:hypothetical protein
VGSNLYRLLKNAHLHRSPHPSSLQRTFRYASLLRISGAFHLGIFDQPEKNEFFNRLFILEFVRNTGVIYKKVGPVLSAWPVEQSAWRYLKLNTKRWTLARPFRIKFEDESRYISAFPFSFLFYS